MIRNIDTHYGRYANGDGPHKDNEWSYAAQISYSLRHPDVLNVRYGLSKANRVALINCLLQYYQIDRKNKAEINGEQETILSPYFKRLLQ
jgi:hypothetical protein